MNTTHPHISTLACDLAAILAPLSCEERAVEMEYFLQVLAAEHEVTVAQHACEMQYRPQVTVGPIDSTLHALADNRRWSLRVARRQALGAES